jgi:hypothetical protein
MRLTLPPNVLAVLEAEQAALGMPDICATIIALVALRRGQPVSNAIARERTAVIHSSPLYADSEDFTDISLFEGLL